MDLSTFEHIKAVRSFATSATDVKGCSQSEAASSRTSLEAVAALASAGTDA